MTNKEWLSTLPAHEWYQTIHWLYHVYGKRWTDTRLAILDWLETDAEQEKRKPTVTEQTQEIFDEICNEYCKYPEIALAERHDVDDANKLLMDKYCATCPIGRL